MFRVIVQVPFGCETSLRSSCDPNKDHWVSLGHEHAPTFGMKIHQLRLDIFGSIIISLGFVTRIEMGFEVGRRYSRAHSAINSR